MADERVWGFRNRRQQNPSSSAKARARNQRMQMRKKDSRECLFQTRETLLSSASAVNAHGRLKIQYRCWSTPTSGLPTNETLSILCTESLVPNQEQAKL